jgi:hypothetical protein
VDPLPSLKKGTRATVEVAPYYASDGGALAIVMIKERFEIDVRQRVQRVGEAEVRLVDEPWEPDQPDTSTIKYPSDLCASKRGTDVLVIGAAMAPSRARSKALDVFVRVGPVERALRVHGTRVYYQGAKGLAISPGEPFEEVPLRWELAYGGSDFSDPRRPLEEPRNPVGRGVARSARDLVNQAAPQIEDPRDPIGGSRNPAPVGTAPLGRHWEPRRSYVGTYDERWMRDRMPLPPLDFDDRFNQVAPPELVTPQPLRGGELVQLLNLNARGGLQFELPRLQFFVGAHIDDKLVEHRPMLDTVLLEPNKSRVEMTWRSSIPLPKKRSRVHFIQVHEKDFV